MLNAEITEPVTIEDLPAPQVSHRRILISMAVIIVAGTIAGFILGSALWGLGILTGGVMSYVNYFWQKSSTRAIFEHAANGTPPAMLAVRYILRYVVVGGVVGIFYMTGAFPITAVVLGLAAFVFAVVLEGLIIIFEGSFK